MLVGRSVVLLTALSARPAAGRSRKRHCLFSTQCFSFQFSFVALFFVFLFLKKLCFFQPQSITACPRHHGARGRGGPPDESADKPAKLLVLVLLVVLVVLLIVIILLLLRLTNTNATTNNKTREQPSGQPAHESVGRFAIYNSVTQSYTCVCVCIYIYIYVYTSYLSIDSPIYDYLLLSVQLVVILSRRGGGGGASLPARSCLLEERLRGLAAGSLARLLARPPARLARCYYSHYYHYYYYYYYYYC